MAEPGAASLSTPARFPKVVDSGWDGPTPSYQPLVPQTAAPHTGFTEYFSSRGSCNPGLNIPFPPLPNGWRTGPRLGSGAPFLSRPKGSAMPGIPCPSHTPRPRWVRCVLPLSLLCQTVPPELSSASPRSAPAPNGSGIWTPAVP